MSIGTISPETTMDRLLGSSPLRHRFRPRRTNDGNGWGGSSGGEWGEELGGEWRGWGPELRGEPAAPTFLGRILYVGLRVEYGGF